MKVQPEAGHSRTVWTETVVGSLSSTLGTVCAMLALAVSARVWGPGTYGVYGAAIGWIAFLASAAHLSLNQVIVHHVSKHGKGDAREVFGTSLIFAAISSSLVCLIVVVLGFAAGQAVFGHVTVSLLTILFPQLAAMLWIMIALGFFQALSKVTQYYWITFAGSAANAYGVVVAVGFFHKGIVTAALVASCSAMLCAAALIIIVRRQLPRPRFSSVVARSLAKSWSKLCLAAIGYLVFSSADLLMLNRFSSPEEVAWYRIATSVFGIFVFIPAAMSSSVFALATRLGPDGAWPHQKRLLLQAMALATVGALAFFPLWPTIVDLLAGPGYEPAGALLRVLSLGIWGMTLSTLIAPQWILRGMFVPTSIVTIVIGVVNLVVNFWAIPLYGGMGAAWTKVGCFALGAVVNLFAAREFGKMAASKNSSQPKTFADQSEPRT